MKFNDRVIDLLNNKELSKLDIKRLEEIFPELKESEDERMRKILITYLSTLKHPFFSERERKEILYWLEKQGEQKQWPHVEPLSEEDKLHLMLDEQKPADKVEPKFKVGDWVVWDNKISCRVDNIYQGKEALMYTITDTNNATRSYSVKGFDNNAHLWTIQDAKDGDVLTTDTWTFIFKKCQDKSVCYHCAASAFNNFCISDTGEFDSNYVHPSTKEQRDLLFAEMKEAGYEWNAEKKKLKKIGQEELSDFEKSLKHIMEETLECGDTHNLKADAEILLGMVRKQVNPTWSEEDETGLTNTIIMLKEGASLHFNKKDIAKAVNWLKSLKDKVGARVQPRNMWISVDKEVYIKEPVLAQKKDKSDPFKGYVVCCDHTLDPNIYKRYIRLDKNFPHITWKPSDEQMNAIDSTLQYGQVSHNSFEHLNSLFNDLKKLKGH